MTQTLLAICFGDLAVPRFLPQLFFTASRTMDGTGSPACCELSSTSCFHHAGAGLSVFHRRADKSDAPQEEEDSAGAVDALIEAGKEEGILEESDRALVRSALEFGDEIVREVMTPRPAIFCCSSQHGSCLNSLSSCVPTRTPACPSTAPPRRCGGDRIHA